MALPAFVPTRTLTAQKRPRGELVVTTTFTNWRYSVTMRHDGAIVVGHGHWLSKYSAALHNDFTKIHDYARRDKSGVLRWITNANLIFAGETIYHVPTYKKANPIRMPALDVRASHLSDEQREKLILATVLDDIPLEGERLHRLEELIHYEHAANTGLQVAKIAHLIAEEAALGVFAEFAELFSSVVAPIAIAIAVLNASDTDLKLAGMQGASYALTAWAFGKTIPAFPASLKVNNSKFPGDYVLPKLESAWTRASQATVSKLEEEAERKRPAFPDGVGKEEYQSYLQSFGHFDPRKLARLCLDAWAEDLNDIQQMSLRGLDPDKFPN